MDNIATEPAKAANDKYEGGGGVTKPRSNYAASVIVWSNGSAAALLPDPLGPGFLRSTARAVSRCKTRPKFCSALKASVATDSPDISAMPLATWLQTFRAACPHAPEWPSMTIGIKAMPSLAQWASVSRKLLL